MAIGWVRSRCNPTICRRSRSRAARYIRERRLCSSSKRGWLRPAWATMVWVAPKITSMALGSTSTTDSSTVTSGSNRKSAPENSSNQKSTFRPASSRCSISNLARRTNMIKCRTIRSRSSTTRSGRRRWSIASAATCRINQLISSNFLPRITR